MRIGLRSVRTLLFGLALLLAMIASGFAQTTGEITGVITDGSGAAVNGASVTVTNIATGATRRVTTNSEGVFSFPSLMPGGYTLKVEQMGFKTAMRDSLQLEV